MQTFAAALLLSIGAIVSSSVEAASCQTYLQNQVDWAGQAPSGTDRSIHLVMVSNEAKRGYPSSPMPEVSYLATALKKGSGFWSNTLVGSGGTMFNNHVWYQGFLSFPFNKDSTEKWTVVLVPTSNTLWVVRNGATHQVPLNCEGSLMSGNFTHYVQFNNFKYAVKDTKYVVSLTRQQLSLPK